MPRAPYSARFYLAFLFGFSFLFLARWPIFAADFDLWYHLAAGRYFFQNHHLPDSSFFSFLEPPRRWVDYYWLFQVFVYRLYSLGGYWALVAFRALAFLALLGLIFLWLLKRFNQGQSPYLIATLALLYLLMLIPRYASLRPHVFTYFFIALALFLIEFRSRLSLLLPLIGILWVNVHGINYPILLLIAGSYLWDKRFPKKILLITACTVLATPHGISLLSMPFRSSGFAFKVIRELTPLAQQHLFSLSFFMLFLVAAAVLYLFLRKRLRLSHFLLWAAAMGLAFKSNRLIAEAILLSLPVFLESLSEASRHRGLFPSTRFLKTLVWVLLIVVPVRFLDRVNTAFADPAGYPLSRQKLPEGVVGFLNRANKPGRVFNYPNSAGFLEWELDPSYKIYMDLQVPFLFSNEDLGRVVEAFSNPQAMQAAVAAYQPSFITTSLRLRKFPEVIGAVPGYVLVCFDDNEALYADSQRHPDLASLTLDPFALYESPRAAIEADMSAYKRQVPRLLEMAPEGELSNYAAGVVRLHEGSYDWALRHAQTIISNHPHSYLGYLLKAESLTLLGQAGQAKQAYRRGLVLRRRAEGG